MHHENRWKAKIKFAWRMLFDKSFRYWLLMTLDYAQRMSLTVHGQGASDVEMFLAKYGDIWAMDETVQERIMTSQIEAADKTD